MSTNNVIDFEPVKVRSNLEFIFRNVEVMCSTMQDTMPDEPLGSFIGAVIMCQVKTLLQMRSEGTFHLNLDIKKDFVLMQVIEEEVNQYLRDNHQIHNQGLPITIVLAQKEANLGIAIQRILSLMMDIYTIPARNSPN